MDLDFGAILVALAGLCLAVSFAVLAGIATARLLFHASSDPGDRGR